MIHGKGLLIVFVPGVTVVLDMERAANRTKKSSRAFVFFLSLLWAFHLSLFAKEDYAQKAQSSMDMLNYLQAVEYYGQALAEQPQRQGLRTKQAFAYFRLGRNEDAVRVLTEEISFFSDNLDAPILLSYIYYSTEDLRASVEAALEFIRRLEKAVKQKVGEKSVGLLKSEHFAEFAEDNPNLGLPYFVLGLNYKGAGEYPEALAHFRSALQAGYDAVQCHIQLVDVELNRGAWPEVLKRIEEAIQSQGPQAEFDFLLGYTYDRLNEVEMAVNGFAKAARLKPCLLESTKNLAKLFFYRGEYKKAVPLFRLILNFSPLDFDSKSLLERALQEKAVSLERESLKLSKNFADIAKLQYIYVFKTEIPEVVKIMNSYSLALVRQGWMSEAKRFLMSFLELYDRSPELNYNLAHLYNISHELEQALRYAWRATELKPDFRDAYDLIGNIFFKARDFENAARFYQEVLHIDPKDAQGHYNLACVYAAEGDNLAAEEHWKKAIQYEKGVEVEEEKTPEDVLAISLIVRSKPVSFEAHKSLGKLYLEQGKKEAALEEFLQAVRLRPSDPELHYEIGHLYFEKDKFEQAAVFFEKYLYLGGKKEEEVTEILSRIKPPKINSPIAFPVMFYE